MSVHLIQNLSHVNVNTKDEVDWITMRNFGTNMRLDLHY